MTRRSLQALFFQSSHPSDEELLACLDGELDDRAAARVRAHLDTCWRCRGRRDRFDRTIAAFVDIRLEDYAGRPGMPPSATLRLSGRLDAVDARAEKKSWWTRLFWRARLTARLALRTWPSPARLAQVSAVGALTAVLIVLSFGREPVVSAQELLARTVAAQEARLRPVEQPVVYQRLQVSRRAGAGPVRESHQTWEIWSDTTHGRYRERVGAFAPIVERTAPDAASCSAALTAATPAASMPPAGARAAQAHARPAVATSAEAEASEAASPRAEADESSSASTPVRELEAILCSNGLFAAQPLSAAAFRDWRGRVRDASDRVNARAVEGEREAMVLRTSLSDRDRRPNRIREAELVVRADDWHPLVQRFVIQSDDRAASESEKDANLVSYELRELSFEVVPLATVAPTFFDTPRETTAAPVTLPAVEAVSEADLVSAEVQAWEALHRLGALLGEPVEVARNASHRVEVRGLASSIERKHAIVEAVSAIPLVSVDVRTVDEALAAKRAARASASHVAGPPDATGAALAPSADDAPAMIQTGVLPIQPLLDAALPTPQARTQAATDVVTLSRDAMSQAWALERLARFTLGLDASAIRASSRRTLERVALELAQGTVEKLDALEQRVTPIVSPLLESPSSASTSAPSSPTSLEAAAAAAETDANTNAPVWSANAADWPRGALQVFARVREADEKTRRLFTESDNAALELSTAARALIASCEAGRRVAVDITRTLTSKAIEEPATGAPPPRPPR